LREFLVVPVVDLDAARIRQHLHHRRADIGKRYVAAGHGQGCGIHDQVGEPQPHGALFTEDALECRFQGSKIEKRLVDIEDDQGKSGHVTNLLSVAPGREFVSPSALVL
jgi:hypothetical protein